MLVLSRRKGDSLQINGDIEVRVLAVNGKRVRLGVRCPQNIRILRAEVIMQEFADHRRCSDSDMPLNSMEEVRSVQHLDH
jgi:carbon storage regulator